MSESTARPLSLLSSRFICRLYLVRHSVTAIVPANHKHHNFNQILKLVIFLFTHIHRHSDKYNQTKPGVECSCKIDYSNQNVHNRRENIEKKVTQKASNRVCSPINYPQYFSCLLTKVPAKTQMMKMIK